MNFANFSTLSQSAIKQAHTLASQGSNAAVEPAHIMVSIVQLDKELVFFLLNHMGVDRNAFCTALGAMVKSFPKVQTQPPGFSPSLNRVFEKSGGDCRASQFVGGGVGTHFRRFF